MSAVRPAAHHACSGWPSRASLLRYVPARSALARLRPRCLSLGRQRTREGRALQHRTEVHAIARAPNQPSATATDAQPFHRADWPTASRSCQTLGGFEYFACVNRASLGSSGAVFAGSACSVATYAERSFQYTVSVAAKIAASAEQQKRTEAGFPERSPKALANPSATKAQFNETQSRRMPMHRASFPAPLRDQVPMHERSVLFCRKSYFPSTKRRCSCSRLTLPSSGLAYGQPLMSNVRRL